MDWRTPDVMIRVTPMKTRMPIFPFLLALILTGSGFPDARATLPSGTQAGPANSVCGGFATVSAYGLQTTTGGAGGPVIEVWTLEEFRSAVENSTVKKKKERGKEPRIVRVMADIDLGPLGNEKPGNELKSVGKIEVASNTTIEAPGQGAVIRHGELVLHGVQNVIIRNLRFRDLWENDPSGKYDRFGWDYIRVCNSGKTFSHHVWIDHCDFGKCYDGQCDITHGSDLVTVSWCRFSGDERGPHKKSMLIGHSSSDTAAATDRGRLNVTLHHNWWENICDRAPRVRFGNIHAYDNLVDGAENATISVAGAVTLLENCVYKDARIATSFSHAADSVEKDHAGSICIVDCLNLDPRPPRQNQDSRGRFETEHNFTGNVDRAALKFNPPADWSWPNPNVLPYPYQPDPTAAVPDLIRRSAGAGKLP
jgi:pectate lyase